MDNEQRLREAIRKLIKKEINEATSTGNVAGYLTPNAFVGPKGSNHARIQQMAKRIGYTLTKRGSMEADHGDKLQELKESARQLAENYYEYRNDPTKLPHQKIGTAIAEVSRQLKLIERVLRMNHRLQTESGVSNDRLWKRTQHQMTKLEGKLMQLAGRLREMRG
jgi:hypothetical protein